MASALRPSLDIQSASERELESEALDFLREALEHHRLCDPSIEVDDLLQIAVNRRDYSVVDSMSAATILAGAFGGILPREVLNHRNLTTMNGLQRSLTFIKNRGLTRVPGINS